MEYQKYTHHTVGRYKLQQARQTGGLCSSVPAAARGGSSMSPEFKQGAAAAGRAIAQNKNGYHTECTK